MANYSLSPALKAAFEQVYGPPFLARLLFVELGPERSQNSFLRIDYDGAIQTNGTPFSKQRQEYAALSGTKVSAEAMEKLLARDFKPGLPLGDALKVALHAWTIGFQALDEDKAPDELPSVEKLREQVHVQLANASIEAAVLEAAAPSHIAYRPLTEQEIQPLLPPAGNA